MAAAAEVTDGTVNVSSSASEVDRDAQASLSTSKLLSAAEADDDVDTQSNNNNNNGAGGGGDGVSQVTVLDGNGRNGVSSMSSVAGLLNRRAGKTPHSVTPTDASPTVVTLHDVRKFVFQSPGRSDKRIMAGLTAHTFTSQTFISSFAVGLAIGSILAIIIKLLTELGWRALPYHR